MPGKGKVRVKDRGAKRLLDAVAKNFGGKALKVGTFGDAAAQRHEDSSLSVGDVMASHEFGLGTTPQRSWLRATLDQHAQALLGDVKQAALAVYQNRATPQQALGLLGIRIVGLIQERIASGIAPALGHDEGSKRYLKRKLAKYPGATTALIASGQGRSAITSAVVQAKDARGRFVQGGGQ